MIRWVPGHRGASGHEIADTFVKKAAKEKTQQRKLGRISASFFKRKAAKKATRQWRDHVLGLNKGKRTFNLPKPNSKPKMRTDPRTEGRPGPPQNVLFPCLSFPRCAFLLSLPLLFGNFFGDQGIGEPHCDGRMNKMVAHTHTSGLSLSPYPAAFTSSSATTQ